MFAQNSHILKLLTLNWPQNTIEYNKASNIKKKKKQQMGRLYKLLAIRIEVQFLLWP